MSGVCDSASNRLEFQDDALIVTLSSLLNKVCESPVELDGTKSSSEKELLLSLGEDFLRSHPNSTPSQFLRWVLETPTATDGSSTFAPRLKDNNVLLPNDVKDFLTSVKGFDNLSKEEMYEMNVANPRD
ncbi:hypothetical protein L0F63_001327 [Massospora cicadina]|nr:hypothetical protein L0F63_001327 [Massospora cicadina]